MDKFEFTLIVPKCLTTDIGINEDTMFEAYYEDGAIHIKEINETDMDLVHECFGCPYFCNKHETCVLE